jgi:hypothetical protein
MGLSMDTSDAAVLEEFVSGFRSMSAALRTELAFTSEAATIRRVLDHGCPLERGILLTVLGHGENIVLRLAAPDDQEPHAAEAADERARRFLRGLIGDGEPVAKETLRPVLEAAPDDDVLVLNATTGELKPFTAETAKT